jgi:hypothetical protein
MTDIFVLLAAFTAVAMLGATALLVACLWWEVRKDRRTRPRRAWGPATMTGPEDRPDVMARIAAHAAALRQEREQ